VLIRDHTVLSATHTLSISGMNHTCLYSPAAEHHRLLAGAHFTVPQRVEGWVKCTTQIVFLMLYMGLCISTLLAFRIVGINSATSAKMSRLRQDWLHGLMTGPFLLSISVFMVALCNRADHYIFALWFLSFFFFFSSPNLSGRRLNAYHTSTHGVGLVQI